MGLLLKERREGGEMKSEPGEAEVFVAGPAAQRSAAQRSAASALIPTTSPSTCWTGGHSSSLHEEPFTGTPHSRANSSQKKVYAFLFFYLVMKTLLLK